MLEHHEALKKIVQAARPLPVTLTFLKDALGQVLAKDMRSSLALPSFDNSAVDGYAICFQPKDLKKGALALEFKVIGEIAAGALNLPKLAAGQAVQIFTGAPVPAGAQAVVMQENISRERDLIKLSGCPRHGENIRFEGEDIQKGKLLLKKDIVLGAAQIGLLAAAGVAKVPVIGRPQVTILATGNELKKPGEKIRAGQIFDSNTELLRALVEESACLPLTLAAGQDHPLALKTKIRQGLKADVFLIAGGVSVGKYDLVKEILRQEGVREIFWKVNIKPGKPLYFGRKGKTLVFGLPGNPVSVFVTFAEYVKPALRQLQGKKAQPAYKKAQMAINYQNGSRRHFVRCLYTKAASSARVTPLSGQGSHMIHSLAQANALLEVSPSVFLRKNQEVEVKLFGLL